jgi:hypothetical protein
MTYLNILLDKADTDHGNAFFVETVVTLILSRHVTSDSGAAGREGRTILGAQAKPLKWLYLGNRSE